MRRITNLISTCICLTLLQAQYAQVNDAFTDGNYTANPTWTGDNSKFFVASGELWLNAPAVTDVAFLSTPSLAMVNSEWQFYNRMEFNPSSSNFCRFYLVSDQRNLNAPNINGYYVELGRLTDEISLYKVVNGSATKIIDGPDNLLNVAACTTRVKVTRTANQWELFADTTGGTSFVSLGTVLDGAIAETYFVGAYCKYTATRSDKFFFDDVSATGTNWADATTPNIITHTAGTNLLTIQLNEPIVGTDLTLVNFSLDNGLSVTNVVEDSLDCKKLKITASGNFVTNVLYHLNITSLHDFAGNTNTGINYPFILHAATAGELVINEVMADPSPTIGLPDAEFIELKNNSIYPISLNQWSVQIGSTAKTLPPYVVQPGDMVILTDVLDTALFGASIKKIGITSFPTLGNINDHIALLDTGGVQMDEINYDLTWYHDANKDDGGYSLERINPVDICLTAANWKASGAVAGGTPSVENSVYDINLAAVSVQTFWVDSVHLLLVFNQLMNPSGFVMGNFSLPNLSSIQTISADSCILVLSAPLTANTSFDLTISSSLSDCGNVTLPAAMVIPVINYVPQLFDLLITELMIDEAPPIALPAAEYIEIYNSKPFAIPTNGFTLNVNGTNYTLGNYTIPADSFLVLTHENNVTLFSSFNTAGIASFGGLTNDNGLVALYHSSGALLHATKYDIEYYDVAGKDAGGWSLEMIDNTQPCLRNVNWTASQDPMGGTPGRRNSFNTILLDNVKPHALKTGILGTDTLIAYFDESILPSTMFPGNVELLDGTGITSITYSSPLLDEYKIHIQNPVPADSIFYIQLNGLLDCAGNVISIDSLPYSQPVTPNNFDIIINEVLADPTTNCIDYVEIYNRGLHGVDLSKMILGEGDTSTYLLTSFATINDKSLLLHPGEYLFISEDHEKVMSCYALKDSTSYWDISSLPDFANASGVVGISTNTQQWIDMFAYNDGMHFSALGSTDGVSLERIDINAPTQSNMNWHSAASTVGFGTPGYQNSQFSLGVLISDDFSIDPEVFSPDNDGYKDYVTISYLLDAAGYTATLRIFDQVGRLEKDLVNNELLGTSGSFVWDGTNNNGAKVNVGIHIIYFELVGPNGQLLNFKKPVVVGTKL